MLNKFWSKWFFAVIIWSHSSGHEREIIPIFVNIFCHTIRNQIFFVPVALEWTNNLLHYRRLRSRVRRKSRITVGYECRRAVGKVRAIYAIFFLNNVKLIKKSNFKYSIWIIIDLCNNFTKTKLQDISIVYTRLPYINTNGRIYLHLLCKSLDIFAPKYTLRVFLHPY